MILFYLVKKLHVDLTQIHSISGHAEKHPEKRRRHDIFKLYQGKQIHFLTVRQSFVRRFSRISSPQSTITVGYSIVCTLPTSGIFAWSVYLFLLRLSAEMFISSTLQLTSLLWLLRRTKEGGYNICLCAQLHKLFFNKMHCKSGGSKIETCLLTWYLVKLSMIFVFVIRQYNLMVCVDFGYDPKQPLLLAGIAFSLADNGKGV